MVAARPMVEGSTRTSDDWKTPKWLCELLGPFDLDPCSNSTSHVQSKLTCSLDHEHEAHRDGLTFPWMDFSVFVQPPYSDVGPWATKLAAHQAPWCALLKNDSTTRWYATLMSANPTTAPFRKRLKFEGEKAMTANFPSVLVYKRWAPSDDLAQHLWLQRWG
jgi:DNA N-6-adenine-methyltransferase (Dam)